MLIKKIINYLFDKRTDKITRAYQAITLFIRLTLIFAFLSALYNRSLTILFASTLTFILTFLPYFFKKRYKIYLPVEFEIVVIVFLYASLFLGEIHGYYYKFWWWDIALHISSALAFGFIGFIILYVLYRGNKIKANPLWVALFSFCFAVAIGTVWEIFEFTMDQLFGLNMQKSGLIDTMWDLIVDSLGALIASIFGYIYLKKQEIFIFGKIFKRFEAENLKNMQKV